MYVDNLFNPHFVSKDIFQLEDTKEKKGCLSFN